MPDQALETVRDRISAACRTAGRSPDSVQLLAVSKTQSADKIRALHHAGLNRFGESYADEGVEKIRSLEDLEGLEWHFVGPIQSNKTRLIAGHFDWVHSVDRQKIIRRLADQRPAERGRLNVLIQVNMDDEPTKSGCRPDQVGELAEAVARRKSLRLRGLMAIPAPREDFAGQLEPFRRLKDLYDELKQAHPCADTLSAGMSADLEAAIAAGSTLVRVGTALFGPRPDSRDRETSKKR